MKTGYTVSDVMTEKPVTMKKDDSLVECAKIMKNKHVGAIIIKVDKKIEGIITEQDIVRKSVAESKNPIDMKLSEIMVTDIKTIEPDQDIFEAIKKMRDFNIRHLPVVSNNLFVGLLTIKDILKIEPQLFEILVDKIELREEERKPIPSMEGSPGLCNICGEYTNKLQIEDEVLMCEGCVKQH